MRQNGKHIMQILTAIMRKLAVVAYTLHKTNTTFEKTKAYKDSTESRLKSPQIETMPK